MALKKYRPTTSSRRFMSRVVTEELSRKKPEKSLLISLPYHAGRNNNGRITVRHRGGRHKRKYRFIDFKRDKRDIPAVVQAIEYDPNRSSHIALLKYEDGEKRYILHPVGLQVGNQVLASREASITAGNSLPLEKIPEGTMIHNVELKPGRGGKLGRSAGSGIQFMAREGDWAHLKLPSGEIRMVKLACWATVGQVGNIEHDSIMYGSAGRRRHSGIRPTVRGTAMNAVDHPHGGGRGKSKGHNQPSSPWGIPTKGYKARKKRNKSDQFIIKRRIKRRKG